MKRKTALLLIGVMAFSAVLGGCGKNGKGSGASSAAAENAEAETSEEADTDVIISADELLSVNDYDVTEYVTLIDYMNLDVELDETYEVTDDAIASYAGQIIAIYPAYEASDKTIAEDGDIVNIDYVGKIDGEEFDGGTGEGYRLELGSGTFIDGFEEGLVGVSVGDTVDLNLTFPEDYSNNEDLAGKDVVFTVTVNSIDTEQEMSFDTLTDEYVNENFGTTYGLTTVDEFIDEVTSELESSNESNKQSAVQEKVLDILMEGCGVILPEGYLDDRYLALQETAEEAGYEDLLSYTGYETEEDMMAALEESVKEEMILQAIVKDMNLSISQSDFEAFVSGYVSYYGYESVDEFYESFGGEDYLRLSYAENQALKQVADSANVTVSESAESEGVEESAEGTE